MRSILQCDSQRRLFMRYLHLDYCVELAKFLKACSELEALYNAVVASRGLPLSEEVRCEDEALARKASSLYADFLSPSGPWFINASSENAYAVKQELSESSDRGGLSIACFAAVQREILDYCAKCKLLPFKAWLDDDDEDDDATSVQSNWDLLDTIADEEKERYSSAISRRSSLRRTSSMVRNILDDLYKDDLPDDNDDNCSVATPLSSEDDEDDTHNVWGSVRAAGFDEAIKLENAKETLIKIWGLHHLEKKTTTRASPSPRRRWSRRRSSEVAELDADEGIEAYFSRRSTLLAPHLNNKPARGETQSIRRRGSSPRDILAVADTCTKSDIGKDSVVVQQNPKSGRKNRRTTIDTINTRRDVPQHKVHFDVPI